MTKIDRLSIQGNAEGGGDEKKSRTGGRLHKTVLEKR
jgi:hypothetical protein